ncbi:hypothetical protein Tco_1118086 [Tanacetum coccineum]
MNEELLSTFSPTSIVELTYNIYTNKTLKLWTNIQQRTKARAIIDDEDADQQYETSERRRQQMSNTASKAQYSSQYQLPENSRNADNPALEKGFGDV